MIIRQEPNGQLVHIGQTDHSRLVGQLAAHWGNAQFATPHPYEAVVRAATFHDFGWLRYETSPSINPQTGEPLGFGQHPFSQKHLDAQQWCIDWLADVEPYSGLIVSMHRTGLAQQRYQKIAHGSQRRPYQPGSLRPELQAFVDRNEAWQKDQIERFGADEVWTNYCLQQVWDLLGLYFCCQEPYEEHIEPVPAGYDRAGTVRLTMRPAEGRRVVFDPYPFDQRPLRVQFASKRLPLPSYPDEAAYRRAYFQAPVELLEYELV